MVQGSQGVGGTNTLAESRPRRGLFAWLVPTIFSNTVTDDPHRVLLKEWTAFPSTYKVPMSLAEMHRRLKFAKDLGFRVLLYFADGTNSDSGAPNFRKEYLLKDKNGETFSGFKGPDSVGQPLMMRSERSGTARVV